jgi:DNA-binding response OmpR family regulator
MSEATLLVVSPCPEDHNFIQRVFKDTGRTVLSVETCQEAVELAGRYDVRIVIAERTLGDGCWREMWTRISALPAPPLLIVTSRHADNRLWGEVLNLGGFDVLAKPLDEGEVRRVVAAAERRRQAQLLAVEQV